MSMVEAWFCTIDREATRLAADSMFDPVEIKAVMTRHGSAIGKAAVVLAPTFGMDLADFAERLRNRLGEVVGACQTTDELRIELNRMRKERDELYAEVMRLRGGEKA